jgi:hypothetical protein
MLSLEQRIYLIQCWTGFRHIIIKLTEKFPNTYVSRRVELCRENGGELIEYFYIQLAFDLKKQK